MNAEARSLVTQVFYRENPGKALRSCSPGLNPKVGGNIDVEPNSLSSITEVRVILEYSKICQYEWDGDTRDRGTSI